MAYFYLYIFLRIVPSQRGGSVEAFIKKAVFG